MAGPLDDPLDELTRSRQLVLGVALLVSALKLVVATSTGGTIDLQHWAEFARGVHQLGPFGVYTGHFAAVYNHPPLIGWWLVALNWLAAHGVALRLMIRLPAIVADVVTALLVLELLRTRRSLREARLAGLLVAASPVLVVISGYHGNTDPVFVMLTLLSAYLLADRRMPMWAGVALGVAISVKLVPVVVLPALLAAAWQGMGRRGLARFVAGAGAVFVVVWLPAIATQWSALRSGVLDYAGSNQGTSQWGLGQILRWLPGHEHTVSLLSGPGRFVVLAVCALGPAWYVRRRVSVLPTAVALSLCLFLLLTPTFGTQYLAWAAAPAVLLWLPGAAAFTGTSTVLLVEAYTRWNHGLPWDQATKWGLDVFAVSVAFLAWLALLLTCAVGVFRVRAAADAGQSEGPAAEQRGLPLRGPSGGPPGDTHASGGVGRGLHSQG